MSAVFKCLLLSVALWVSIGFGLVHAQTQVDSKMTGSWFDPSHTGEQQLYHLANDPFEESNMVSAGIAPAEVIEDLQFLVNEIRQ